MSLFFQAGIFTNFCIDLGNADKMIQDQTRFDIAGTAASFTKLSRIVVTDTLSASGNSDSNVDATLNLSQSLRGTEQSLSSSFSKFYGSTLASVNGYFISIVGSSFRDHFNSKTTEKTIDFAPGSPTVAATGFSAFRDLYRRVYTTELITKLYDYNSSAALVSTGATYDFAGSLLELRKNFSTGTSGSITLSLTKLGGGTESVSVSLPIAGAGASYYNIESAVGSQTKYTRVNSVSVSGLASGLGRTFEVWVR